MTRKLTFYAVSDGDVDKPLEEKIIYCITYRRNECEHYIDVAYRLKYNSHYVAWCDLHQLDYTKESSWEKYKDIVLSERSDFAIYKLIYTPEQIAVAFRMFNCCTPIGCYFETELERKYFYDNLSEKDKEIFKDYFK